MTGIRPDLSRRVYCDRHEPGDPYPPQCQVCDSLTYEYALLNIQVCVEHPYELKPCQKCEPENA